jgi:hypothetical protein
MPWSRLVQIYSSCSLSKEADKLVAISGIARDFYQKSEDEYLAGLWTSSLIRDLLWRVPPPAPTTLVITGDHSRRPKYYRAPSWSWASVDGILNLDGTRYLTSERAEPCAKLLESSITPLVEGDVFGQVKDGYIRIQAYHLITPKLHRLSVTYVRLMGDGNLLAKIELLFDAPPYNYRESVVLMLVQSSHSNAFSGLSMRGLVLEAQGTKGCYTRVGMFTIPKTRYDSSGQIHESLTLEQFLDLPGLLDEHDYHSIVLGEDGKKSYIVTLI